HVRIDRVPGSVIKIIDVKCPDSHEEAKNCWDNIDLAKPHDEFKFVIASRTDYEWARSAVAGKFQGRPNTILFSPSHDDLPAANLARWILDDGLPVRMQLQMHKTIWGSAARGV